MNCFRIILISLMCCISLCSSMVRAEDPTPIAKFIWRGVIADKVGTGPMAGGDGVKEHCFQTQIVLPEATEVESLDVYLCDEKGVKLGEYWLSREYDRAWILGVFHDGKLLNPQIGKSLGTFTGQVIFDLHGNDSGRIAPDNYFLLDALIGGKRYTKILKTGLPSEPLTAVPHPVAPPTSLLDTTNKAAVQNIPLFPTFTITEAHRITFIMTYHYFNNGVLPGTIALRHADGTLYGPWQATGRAGQGGVANANWDVHPDVVIKAGLYTIIDSDPNTWSTNAESNNRGHAIVKGHPEAQQITTTDKPQFSNSTVFTEVVLPPMHVRREVGGVVVAGAKAQQAVIDRVTAQPATVEELAQGARQAYDVAAASGMYLMAKQGYQISIGADYWLTGTLVLELPLPAELRAQASQSNVGALWLSETGPVFVRGVLTADRQLVRVPTNHFSSWFPCLRNKQAELDDYIKAEAARRAGVRESDFDDKVLIMGTKYLKLLGESVSDEQRAKIINQLEARRDDIKNIAIAAGEGNEEKLAVGTAEMIGKIIVDNLDDAGVATVLKKVGSNFDLIKLSLNELNKVGVEDSYDVAVMNIARAFLEKQPVSETAKLLVETVQLGCDAVQDKVWQQAYTAYRDGIQHYLLLKGVKINAGDWEIVKERYSTPIVTYLRSKHKAWLTEEEALAMAKQMMDARRIQETVIVKEEEQLRTLHTIFKNYNWTDDLRKQSKMTDELDQFNHFVKLIRKIEYDLNRSGISGPALRTTALYSNALALLNAYALDGDAGYDKKLRELRAMVSRKLGLPNGMVINFVKLPWSVDQNWPNGNIKKQNARTTQYQVDEWYREDGSLETRLVEPLDPTKGRTTFRLRYHPNGRLKGIAHSAIGIGEMGTSEEYFEDGKLKRLTTFHPVTIDNKTGAYRRENSYSAKEVEYFNDGRIAEELVRDINGDGTKKRYLPDGRHWYTDYFVKNVVVRKEEHLTPEQLKGVALN